MFFNARKDAVDHFVFKLGDFVDLVEDIVIEYQWETLNFEWLKRWEEILFFLFCFLFILIIPESVVWVF